MIKKYLKIFSTILTIGILGIMSSCSQDEPENSPYVGDGEGNTNSGGGSSSSEEKGVTVLLYAVASNNLLSNYYQDREEIIMGAPQLDIKRNNILICETIYEYDEENNKRTGKADISLLKLVKTDDGYDWETLKKYSNETAALDPERIREVLNYTVQNYPANNYGMIFWSHSAGSEPYLQSRSIVQLPSEGYFGIDETMTNQKYYSLNIDELADALPDNLLNFIWFDSCYMGNIESAYQLRNKCKYFVGYATEVWSWGMPYQTVLPQLVKETPDVVEGAKIFFDYYYDLPYANYRNATVAVVETSQIENLAAFCKEYYESGVEVSPSSFIKYTRGKIGPFYDLGDYTKAIAASSGKNLSDEEWEEALSRCVIYRAATEFDFAGHEIDPQRYSGLSTHIYSFGDNLSKEEAYYQSFDWFKATF